MTKRWLSLLPGTLTVFVLAISCGSSDGGDGTGGAAGLGGRSQGGASGTSGGVGAAGNSTGENGGAGGNAGAGGNGGADTSGGAAGTDTSGGAAGSAGADTSGGAAGSVGADTGGGAAGSAGADTSGGAAGSAGVPTEDTSPLNPAAIPDLAFWMDGNAQAFSDLYENILALPGSGRVRALPEASPLTGTWQAPTALQRPIRELGALSMRPVESATGYYVADTAGTIATDNSTVAISLRPLNSNSAQGGLLSQPIGTSAQATGISFIANGMHLLLNHTDVSLSKQVARGAHLTIVLRFTPTGADLQYDVDGFRSSETVPMAMTPGETASNFTLGYDSKYKSDMYGFVSQVVGVNRALSDNEASRLTTWLDAQPIPDAYAVTKPLVAIVGDSIANGDQVAGWQTWAFSMLADLANNKNPDVQLLNDALNGSGIPTAKNSSYSDDVVPWFSADRSKNILIIAAGTNDLASSTNTDDVISLYDALLAAARKTGWKTVACTVLPRSGPMQATEPDFETARTAFNAHIHADYAAGTADAIADVAAIVGMGAAGDSDNTTYYSIDKVHPTAAGHALLEPVYATAVASLL